MNFEIAGRAVSLFLEGGKDRNNLRIRFFGGEPILNFPVVEKTIKFVNKRQKKVVFDITTNGHLLNEKILRKIKKQLNLELILSSDSSCKIEPFLLKKIAQLPNVSININLWPQDLKKVPKTLGFFMVNGFKSFNFLPAFYTKWTENQLRGMKDCLDLLVKIIKKSEGIQVKNLTTNSLLPLFNTALTVDCNGDLYVGNFFLDKRLEFLKNEMKVGNINSLNSLKSVELPIQFDFKKILEMFFDKEILESTNKVNRALTNFCQKLK